MPMDRIIRFIQGPLLILGGLWFIAMPFGFATMRFGDRVSPPPWGEYLGEVFRGGASSIAIGLILVIGGLFTTAPHESSPGQGMGTKKP
jgi:hypothetical protein